MLVTIGGGIAKTEHFLVFWDNNENIDDETVAVSTRVTISSCDSDCFLLSVNDESSDVSRYSASVVDNIEPRQYSGHSGICSQYIYLLPVGEGVSSVKAVTDPVDTRFEAAEKYLPVSIGAVGLPTPFLHFCSEMDRQTTIGSINSDITLVGGNGNDSNSFLIGDDKNVKGNSND